MPAPDVSDRSLTDLLSLRGRRALVTGGAKGIGLAAATRLAEAGAAVAIGDLDKGEAEEAAAGLGGEYAGLGVALDVTDTESVNTAVHRVRDELGGLEILVNNAGVFPITPLFDTTDEQWDKVLSTNLGGAFRCSREVGRVMAEAGNGGVIINLASTQAFRAGAGGLSAYTSSKGALVAFTQALAVELGAFGIRAVAVAPTVVDTPGVQANMPIFEAAGVGDLIAAISAQLPLGRAGVPDDVARVITFLASDLAVLVTGQTIVVDAGQLSA
ncbi:SDR family NAD(P)-dependent oxidoreductase [Pseudonocardia spinosispora]|uniref:SDR family NAD(P)-dependent oxidoreductase n=1 Tax=Pseudonocardia spinosispora TaxID=103441 RepID=UPI0004103230|nr:SDR family NAD(P)-dependent oxidoreductase [Pseudonocardia spinosispora]